MLGRYYVHKGECSVDKGQKRAVDPLEREGQMLVSQRGVGGAGFCNRIQFKGPLRNKDILKGLLGGFFKTGFLCVALAALELTL